MPKILPDNEIAEGVKYLNSGQREIYNVVHTWAKIYVTYDIHNVEPIHIFLSGSGGTGKSHFKNIALSL